MCMGGEVKHRWAVTLLVLGGCPCWAQGTQEHVPVIQAGAVLVEVPALVTGTSAESAFALSAADFRLRDNGAEQAISLDQDGTRPLSLVMLMQTGSTAKLVFPLYRGLETMIATVLGAAPYRVSVVTFDSRIEGATPFTTDLAEWKDAINAPEDGDHGAAVYDGLAFAIKQLNNEPPGNRHVVLLISQPQDDGSKTSAKEIIRAAGESNTTIYSLTFSPEEAQFKAELTGPPRLNAPIVVNPAAGPTQNYFDLGDPLRLLLGGLRKDVAGEIAGVTGGESLRFHTAAELSLALNTVTNHLANRYLLSFTPSTKHAGLHLLDVRLVNHPDLSVTARQTYWFAGSK